MNQQEFLEGVNHKKLSAWKQLYRYYYGALCNYSMHITSDHTVSEDIVQECFIAVWNSTSVFNDLKALKVYFFRAVCNNSLKYLRDKQVDEQHLKQWQDKQEEMTEDYFYQAVEEEVIRRVNQVMTDLPEQQRRVLEMSMSGMTVQAVAEALGMTVNTVKTHKKRAYAYLKAHLQDIYLFLPFFFTIDPI